MTAPFNLDRFLRHIPEIESRIRESNLDAIVWGVGPTAWLLPWIDPDLLAPLRKWTSHDGCRVMRAHDLVLMDPAWKGLHPDTVRYKAILDSKPDRIWCHRPSWDGFKVCREAEWSKHLPEEMQQKTTLVRFRPWHPEQAPFTINPKLNHLDEKTGEIHPDTCAISPAGCATLAWREGCRRIGVIGADMLPHHAHNSCLYRAQVDVFLAKTKKLMHEAGGALVNLSPITSLQLFDTWNPSVSLSAPTAGSVKPAPKPSSNTVFVPARPATFPLPGCEAGIPDGKSAG